MITARRAQPKKCKDGADCRSYCAKFGKICFDPLVAFVCDKTTGKCGCCVLPLLES